MLRRIAVLSEIRRMRMGPIVLIFLVVSSASILTSCGGAASAQAPASSTPVPSTPTTSSSFQLTVAFSGNGTGSVVSTPAGITCRTGNNSGCSASLPGGTTIKLAATPDPLMVLSAWQGGGCSGTGPTCTFALTADTNIVVAVNQAPLPPPANAQLTVIESGGGQGSVVSSPNGVNCPGTCSASFPQGTQITLTATAAKDSNFGGYSGACTTQGTTSPSPTCTFAASGNESVTAVFTSGPPPPPPPTAALSVTINGKGNVTSSPAGIDCPTTCNAGFPQGTVVTLTANNTVKGWQLNSWGGVCANSGATCKVTITNTNQSATATFTSPDLTYGGGYILPTTTTKAIFWGVRWGDPAFVADKITGIDSWYEGVGGSSYAGSVDEYTDASGEQVSAASTYAGHLIDTTAATDSQAIAEACKLLSNPAPKEYIAVYLDQPRKPGGFCAYHTYSSCANNPTVFEVSVFYNLDGDSGCDPNDTVTGHSQGLAALANLSGHEFSEARTDPAFTAWIIRGEETGDLCWDEFASPFVTFSNGTKWKIQTNWSNFAYDNGLGIGGGCVDFNVTGK